MKSVVSKHIGFLGNMANNKMDYFHRIVLCFLLVPILSVIKYSHAIHFLKNYNTYAQYPKWDACINSSISFEFKTSLSEAILMYTDDNGNYDYVEVTIIDSKVRLRMNIVDGREGSIEITVGDRVNDNRWHRVEVQRNRMETTLFVDEFHESRVAFGSDFYFGNASTGNNYVYFGGLPISYSQNLEKLSLASALYEGRFAGDLRNVIYGNCSCRPVRAVMLDSASVTKAPLEACEAKNECGKCLCISGDDGPGCQCIGFNCPQDSNTYYHLPMDVIEGNQILNPSGLDANFTGSPELVPAVLYTGLKIDCSREYVKVSGPGHRDECFGDLSLCPDGYTIGMWFKFDKAGTGRGVYLSNGGHTSRSHGVAMFYQTGSMDWVFRMKNGREWRTTAVNILPRRWYQVMVTWHRRRGVTIYINGNKVAQHSSPTINAMVRTSQSNDDFIIGQSNDHTETRDLGVMTIDDFQFWSYSLDETTMREKGPIYQYHVSMDRIENGQLLVQSLEPRTRGVLRQVPGVIGNAAQIPGRGQYIDLGSFTDTCLGNTTLCMYGFTVTFWIRFDRLEDNNYFMTSSVSGFALFSYGGRLYANVQYGDRQYQASVTGVETGKWYFLELTWSSSTGLEIFKDQKLVASQTASNHYQIKPTNYNNFYIGRANSVMATEKYAAISIDELQIYNAGIELLLAIDFIQRGKPIKHHYGFDVMDGTRIMHPSTVIQTEGNPTLVPGKINSALRLDGRRQAAEFNHGDGCLGNLDYCRHGILLAFWFRPERASEGMVYLSSGINGVEVSNNGREFRVAVASSVYVWEVLTTAMKANMWYYVEITWSEEMGLRLYIDNKDIVTDTKPSENTARADSTDTSRDRFTLGKGNKARGVYGAATIDEMDFWYNTRGYLIAFKYIQRGKPVHHTIRMDNVIDDGKQLENEDFIVKLFGRPLLVPGKIDQALKLNGNKQFIDFGQPNDVCLGNLEKCRFGLSIFFWAKIDSYTNNMYLLSTGTAGIKMYYLHGYIFVTLDNDRKSWRLSVPKFTENEWHFVELSWHPEFGLSMYVDHELLNHVTYKSIPKITPSGDEHFYIGTPNEADVQGQEINYAIMAVDQMEVWYGRREELLAFDYIVRDNIGYESFSMETATDGIIDHPKYRVTLERGARLAPGKIGNGVSLQGTGDYVDMGEHMDKCFANLDVCKHGLTVSLWLKPKNLVSDQYFLSTPTYSIYFENGELKANFMSSGQVWTVNSGKLKRNDWNNIMVSWDKEVGLKMFLDDKLMNRDREPSDVPQGDQPRAGNMYIGKFPHSSIQQTANIQADEVQFWYADIDRLTSHGKYKVPLREEISLSKMPASGVLKLSTRTITLKGGATVVTGKSGRAVRLNGKAQFIDMGENLTCAGDLENCRQGFTLRFSMKPKTLLNNMYFLDSYPVSVFYRDGKLYATIRTSTKTWTVGAPGLRTGEWQTIDVSWHPEIGLTMFVNDDEVGGHKTHGTDIEPEYVHDRRTFFGRARTSMRNERYADTTIENIEVFNVRRQVLDSQPADGTSESGRRTIPQIYTTSKPADRQTTVDRVFVTSAPQISNGQVSDIGTKFIRTSVSSTSKIIRFFGDSFIRYDFDVLPSEMLATAETESLSLKFITKDADGLIWIFKGRNQQKMHISLKDSSLVFGYDDSRGQPQTIRVPHPDSRALNDFFWHSVRIDKEGRKLKFYIDGKYATEFSTRTQVQFISAGEVFLGGIQNTRTNTDGIINSNFNGALTDVETEKSTGTNKQLVISFLQYVEAAQKQGEIKIYDPDEWNKNTIWDRTTTAPPVTLPPEVPTPVTFTTGNSVFYLQNALDMRREGSIAFRFRTLEPRGLLAIARGSSESVNFFAIEIFDGILYFVYENGSLSTRRTFSDRRVDDGEWHEVVMTVQSGRLTLTLDGRPFAIPLSSSDIQRMYFYRLYIGGYNDFSKAPWPLYTREGYKGCFESLKINSIGVDLHREIRNSRPVGASIGCAAISRNCQRQPCISGSCRDRMNGYVCDCANTPYTGQNCNDDAIIGGWDGSLATTFDFLNRDLTHTNDISFRFRTLMKDTILFRTEADNGVDFIRSELVNGKAHITISVDGKTKTFTTGNNLNDFLWHTLYLRRRADDVEVWVDDVTPTVGLIGGENYKLQIDRIKFGAVGNTGSLKANNYIGYLQNFIYDDADLFEMLKNQNSNQKWIINIPYDNLPLPTYKPVTITTSDAYFQLPFLRMGLTMKIMFKFKTRQSSGLILYNAGSGNDVIAVELSNGQVRLAYNLGGQNMFTVVPSQQKLNDNKWHTVVVSLNEKGQFTLSADKETITVSTSDGDGRLDLTGSLYIGGLPNEMFRRSSVTNLIESRKGFRGCMASVDLNGSAPELISYARDRSTVLNGCTDLAMVCKPDACGAGVCMPGIEDYWCNCNMTGYAGTPCTDWPVGYYFGKNGGNGIVLYEFPYEKQANSAVDEIAFGFMTKEKNGVLYRVESSLDSSEFIEISLENGFVKAVSNTGSGLVSVSENSRTFNDGQYHVVRYIRTGTNTTLQVDSLPALLVTHPGVVSLFNKVYRVILGGKIDSKGAMSGNFYGIMGGAFYNGHRWFDMMLSGKAMHGQLVKLRGDVVLTKPFILVGGARVTTVAPPDIIIPPDEVIPNEIGGGGFVLDTLTGVGDKPGSIGLGGPGGSLTPIGGVSVSGGNPIPLAATGVGPAPPALAGGARAGAVVGTLLGTMAFMTSLMWALYKLKPGVPAILSPGAGAAGGGAGMSISAPRATSNLGAVQAASAGGGGGGAGAGGGASKVTVVNGSAAGGGGAGGGSSTYTSYFQQSSTSVGGGGAGGGSAVAGGHADAIDSSTLRATGTFSNKGTVIGSPTTKRAHLGSSSTGYSGNYQTNTMQSYGGSSMGGGGGTMDRGYGDRQFMSLSSAGGGDNIPDYDMPMPGTGTLQSQTGQNYSSSTLNTHYNYQVMGLNNTTHNYVATMQTVPVTHTSVMSLIISGGSNTPTPPHSEIYSAHLAPSRDQGFVDRSEDMVIEVPAPVMIVRPVQANSNNAHYKSEVTIQTGTLPSARYTANQNTGNDETSQSHKFMTMSMTSSGKPSDQQTRKSSLQMASGSQGGFGYERLGSYSSETNIDNTFSSGLVSKKNKKQTTKYDDSRDDLYESTMTVTSELRSDSVDNSLFSLTEEGSSTNEILFNSGDNFSLFNISNGTPDSRTYSDTHQATSDPTYAKVNKQQKSSTQTSSTYTTNKDDNNTFEMVQTNYNVTCSAQLKEDSNATTTIDVDTDRDMVESSMSFDDTLKAFESFGDSNFLGGTQIDRGEIVIEMQPNVITKRSTSKTAAGNGISIEFASADGKATTEQTSVSNTSTTTVTNWKTEQQTSQSSSFSDVQFTATSKGGASNIVVDVIGDSSNLLDDELDRSVSALLTGMNVDTAEWTAIKDRRSSSDTDNDVWEVQNYKTVTVNKQGQYMMTTAGGGVTPGAAADEVRVDCCLMTSNGGSVITGSSLGPPQVWDMQNGELQNIMKGDTLGSTNLHLVCNDSLLVGAVHADMEINEYSSRKGVFNHTLQIWDFQTGRPLSMVEGEYCSAMCPMSDSDKVLFGRTDKFGQGTSIIAWDILGNQMIKEMRHDAPVGNNDYISYLNKSKNDRYIVAGFTNSFDNNAEFMTFDMTLTSYNISEPAMLKLDANPECTAILPKDEAVTGLRNGDLVVWNIRAAQPIRQLMGGGGSHAHAREIKSVTLSEDARYLVSTSADGSSKVWDMQTERPIHTLQGHSDEVWCSAISSDNEIVVTGSADGTIRLWRMKNGTEMCTFNCGVDIFYVTMSHDKGTIVALGDKYGARKLIMLQVVRTKIKKIVSS